METKMLTGWTRRGGEGPLWLKKRKEKPWPRVAGIAGEVALVAGARGAVQRAALGRGLPAGAQQGRRVPGEFPLPQEGGRGPQKMPHDQKM